MPYRINIGDMIAYTDTFLDRQSRYHPDMLSAQGKVTALHHLNSGQILADIEWDKPGLPKRVNIKFLIKKNAAYGT
ncbi:MAG TPA: hypothetical protein VHC22_03645 [Pirellulales bacterium]|nr:hypothetical protein [Pirellulales bacterium]